MRMLLIPAHGDMSVVEVDGYAQMAETIGADYIERVRIAPTMVQGQAEIDWALVVDENGGFTDKPLNPIASTLYGTHRHGTRIVGDVLLAREGWVQGGADWVDTDPAEARAYIDGRVLA